MPCLQVVTLLLLRMLLKKKNEEKQWMRTQMPLNEMTLESFMIFLEDRKSLKWVFKTKLKGNGEVGKYKVRLVAKGYKQHYGIDYT